MKLRCKILPKFWDQIQRGEKAVEYRQVESIVLVNTETQEEMELDVVDLWVLSKRRQKRQMARYPEVAWNPNYPMLAILLGDPVGARGG